VVPALSQAKGILVNLEALQWSRQGLIPAEGSTGEGHQLCCGNPPEVQGPVEETGSTLYHKCSIVHRAAVVPGKDTAEGQALVGRLGRCVKISSSPGTTRMLF
jgi:hypothetical protein